MRPNKPSRVALLLAPFAFLTSCQTLPTMESIKYGYSPKEATYEREGASPTDYNNVAAGWAPERPIGAPLPMYGRDGTPVSSSPAGTVVQTSRPINDGVAAEITDGSRNTLLEHYQDTVSERNALRQQNEDLQLAVEMSEMRANDMTQELKSLQLAYDSLGTAKEAVDQQTFDLAARLATAQIARLEAERALLEATLEWRRMSAANNAPLSADAAGPRAGR